MPHKDQIQKNAYHRAYYRENKAIINARLVKINRERRHTRYAEIQTLKTKPCTDCGKSFPYYVMDFDHRDPSAKTMDVSMMIKRMFSWDTVLAEIAKCDLVCANCHRVRGHTGTRPNAPDHSEALVARFRALMASMPIPEDARANPFPKPGLLGKLPDKELAAMTGISREMVAWHRRKAGIVLTRQGERVSA